ncbi:hypothetical protein F8154_13370 [Alkaliphilus pronyensis]|uniref:Uncharacterized protein n=1 Tax=Alkaliphilus pronyensis TaxID=1482732 RepID=A0A6I0EYV5_9FIRM|nr:hypothetical protein [Alkaliphilus pronyensis]KAB3531059.1 hypothetical protein F8154_13370 [Alkaliphilus pronyensis]
MNINEVPKWEKLYDNFKYPYGVYYDLIVQGTEHPRKIELMGAWKTGSLRENADEIVYTDIKGITYGFTNRWSENTPVGYNIWKEVSDNCKTIKEKIPEKFPLEEPEVVIDLKSKKGFGFIWTLFVLHSFYPKVYPLFDQHVFRTYRYIVTNGDDCPNLAHNEWSSYVSYRNFFVKCVEKLNVDYWKLDKAFWAFGKNLKKSKVKFQGKMNKKNKDVSKDTNIWVKYLTLGGKQKCFKWRLDDEGNLIIRRKYKTGKEHTKKISQNELARIYNYIDERGWINLANNVSKLKSNKEKEGLGNFLYNNLDWSIENAQLASHLGSLFVQASIWESNGKKRGIIFSPKVNNCEEMLKKFYYARVKNDV